MSKIIKAARHIQLFQSKLVDLPCCLFSPEKRGDLISHIINNVLNERMNHRIMILALRCG